MSVKLTEDGRPWATHVLHVEHDGVIEAVFVEDGQDVKEIIRLCSISGHVMEVIDLNEDDLFDDEIFG